MFVFANNIHNYINRYNDKKKFPRVVSKIVKKYFLGEYESDLSVFSAVQKDLKDVSFGKKECLQLQKLLRIFFIGQLVGLPTMNSILEAQGLKNKNHQYEYRILCKKLSISTLQKIFDGVFEEQVFEELKQRCQKDNSIFSKELVTAVLDDSIFRMWLKNDKILKEFEDCYGKFFSGQFGRVVYGLKIVTFGLSIDGIFYPMYFEFVPKNNETDKGSSKDTKKATQVAQDVVKKWKLFVEKSNKRGVCIPKIHFSCDNGYNNLALSQTCTSAGLIYISVPGKASFIEYDGKKIKIKAFIEEKFLKLEQEHLKTSKESFTLRFRANYCCQNQEVTFLVFRLKDSKKVSIIYTIDKNIKAKTLRRHWFQRTYIEQFFKILKHVLHIEQAIVFTKQGFFMKICRFAFVAIHAQLLVRMLRKSKEIDFSRKGIISIQRTLCNDEPTRNLLHELLRLKD
jgi:hypothetical protein